MACELHDRFLPDWDVRSRHETRVRSSPERVWRALRDLDLAESWIVWALFRLRGLPRTALRFDGLSTIGFQVLGERPPEEVLLGLIGRFWTLTGGIREVSREAFAAFDEPGYALATWSFELSPAAGELTRVATETRVRCTDEASRRRFRRYWRLVGPFSGLIRREILRQVRRAAEPRRGRAGGD